MSAAKYPNSISKCLALFRRKILSQTTKITISYVSKQKDLDADLKVGPLDILKTLLNFRQISAWTFL